MKKIILSVAGAFLALTVVPQFGLAAAPRAAMQEQRRLKRKHSLEP